MKTLTLSPEQMARLEACRQAQNAVTGLQVDFADYLQTLLGDAIRAEEKVTQRVAGYVSKYNAKGARRGLH